jgi:hypothetical protein
MVNLRKQVRSVNLQSFSDASQDILGNTAAHRLGIDPRRAVIVKAQPRRLDVESLVKRILLSGAADREQQRGGLLWCILAQFGEWLTATS